VDYLKAVSQVMSVGNINALRPRSPLLAPVPVTPAPSHARWSHAGAP
jgi:hypothetical protein